MTKQTANRKARRELAPLAKKVTRLAAKPKMRADIKVPPARLFTFGMEVAPGVPESLIELGEALLKGILRGDLTTIAVAATNRAGEVSASWSSGNMPLFVVGHCTTVLQKNFYDQHGIKLPG